jgi:D-sedoheptulose 7-phosphate isomerase
MPGNAERVQEIFRQSSEAHARAAATLPHVVAEAASVVVAALRGGSKVLLCGNGGSAADAQHIAAELAGRLRREREGLPAVSLTVNPSVLTAVSNDYGYEQVFARQVEALAREGDVLIGISTSGRSANVVRALETARRLGLSTIGLMGEARGEMEAFCDIAVAAPSSDTQRIQEIHIVVGHAICEIVESDLFGP